MNKPAAIVLAGGEGRRMSYQNKGLMLFKNKAFVDYAIERLEDLADPLIISANENTEDYRTRNLMVVKDVPEFYRQGPLAGIYSASLVMPASTQTVLVNPCDTPLLPKTVMQKLLLVFKQNSADIVVASTENMLQPTVFVAHYSVLLDLKKYIENTKRLSLHQWIQSLNHLLVPFEDEALFGNINDATTLSEFEQTIKAVSC